MPTYDYECRQCGRVTEVFQSITAKPKRSLDCEVCGERTPVRRRIGTGGGIVFKGSGFYATDYRGDGYQKAAKADRPATQSESDSKPSPKTADTPVDQPKATVETKSADP